MYVCIYGSVCGMVKGISALKPPIWSLFWTDWVSTETSKGGLCSLHHSGWRSLTQGRRLQNHGQFPAPQRNPWPFPILPFAFCVTSSTRTTGDALICVPLNKAPRDNSNFLCPLPNYTHGKSHFTSARQPAVCVRETHPLYQLRVLSFRNDIPTLSGMSKTQRERKWKISDRRSRARGDSYVSASAWIPLQPYTVGFELPPCQALWKAEVASSGHQRSSSYKVPAISLQTPLEAAAWVSWFHSPNWKIWGTLAASAPDPHFKHKSKWTPASEVRQRYHW